MRLSIDLEGKYTGYRFLGFSGLGKVKNLFWTNIKAPKGVFESVKVTK